MNEENSLRSSMLVNIIVIVSSVQNGKVFFQNNVSTFDVAGGLVVKILACCTGDPSFDPWVENPKLSTDRQQSPS